MLKGKRGLSSVITNVLLILFIIIAIATLGAVILNISERAGNTLILANCQAANPNNLNAYVNCVINQGGMELAIQQGLIYSQQETDDLANQNFISQQLVKDALVMKNIQEESNCYGVPTTAFDANCSRFNMTQCFEYNN